MSIETSVLRVYVASIVLVSALIVLVGGGVAMALVVHRDDQVALALGSTLRVELSEFRPAALVAIPAEVVDEVNEHRAFGRDIIVVSDGLRLTGPEEPTLSTLEAPLDESCTTLDLSSGATRVCGVAVDGRTTIYLLSPLGPIRAAVLPMVQAIAIVATIAVVLFLVIGRRVVRRRIAPLRWLERRIQSLPTSGAGRTLASAWGASEIDALASAFNGLLARTDAAREREQRFAAHAAHELRTPITRLRGRLELARDEVGDVDAVMEHLDAATRSCLEIERTTEALLALARSEADLKDAVDLTEVIEACRAGVRIQEDEAARIVVDAAEQTFVRGDETLLVLALSNLVENALKYASGHVSVRVSAEANAARLVVDDLGPGIPSAELDRVLEPFARGADASRAARGVGLGLALVRHIVVLHGGELTLENRSERGLRAVVRLPSWEPTPPNLRAEHAADHSVATE